MTPPDSAPPFTPIANPFSTGAPVRNPKLFFGREDDFTYVRQRLIAEREGIVLLFVGERRTGKTSILFQILGGKLGEEFLPIFVDMQQLAGVVGDREFFARLAQITLEWARDERLVADYYDFSQGNPILLYDQLLADVQKLFPQRLVFLVDEAEILRDKVAKKELSGPVLIYLASILENRRVSFCLTGSRGLGDSEAEGWRHLLGKGDFREISFLSRDDSLRLIQKPVEGQVFYGEGVVEAIFELTAGHPFYTQIICTNAVDYLNQVRRNALVMEDLEEVIHIIIENPPPQLVYDWDKMGQMEKIALSLVSEVSEGAQHPVSPEDLLAAIERNKYPLNAKADELHMALEKLFARKVLQRTQAGAFYFLVDLFRQWIRRARSIWRLVEEMRPRKSRRPLWASAVAAGVVLVAGAGLWLAKPAEREPVRAEQGESGPATGEIWVESEPRDVEVLVDGQVENRSTPTMLRLKPGGRIIEVRRRDYHSWIDTVEVEAGKSDTLPGIRLQRFTGRLSVTSQPAGAKVQVRGEKDTTAVTPLPGLKLPTGEYEVIVSKAGFLDQRRQMAIGAATDTTLVFALTADVGGLYIASDPAGARIFLDGQDQGRQTPARLDDLSVGQHQVRLVLETYQTLDTTAEVKLGRTDTLSLVLEREPATLELSSEPAGAVVYLEGPEKVQARTPISGRPLKPGHYQIEVELEGYDPHFLERELRPGERFAPPAIELKPQFGKVRIARPLSGTVVVDGKKEHKVPPVDILLQVGTHTLKTLGSQKDTTVQVFKDSTIRVSLP